MISVKSKQKITTMRNIHKIGKELFITSDETAYPYALHYQKEVLKIRAVGENSGELYHDKGFSYPDQCKKIILTTDLELIKDGVQAIDDEFLEWFVKNPSCEEVNVNNLCYGYLGGFADAGYKIIIPKEEAYERTTQSISLSEVDKQETLEEAAEVYSKRSSASVFQENHKKDFINGAKWQQERMYNEEEVKKLIELHSDFIDSKIDYEGINNATTAISNPEWNDEEWF